MLRRVLRATKTKNNKTPAKHVKDWLRRFAMLLPVLGVTWSFGFLTFITSTTVFHYIFTILNSFQGVFIFVSFCILDDSVSPYFFIISFERPRIAPHDFPCTSIVFILCRLLKLREIAKRKKTHCIQKQAVWSSEVGQMGKNLHEYSFTFTLQTSLYYEVTVPCKVECMNSWGTFGLLLVVSNWLPQFYLASS